MSISEKQIEDIRKALRRTIEAYNDVDEYIWAFTKGTSKVELAKALGVVTTAERMGSALRRRLEEASGLDLENGVRIEKK